MPNKRNIRIFVSYSAKDRALRKKLVDGLKSHLVNRPNYEYTLWVDQEIVAGSDWKENIQRELRMSNAALLLVDADFVASPFIQEEELASFFTRDRNEFLVIPILLRAYDFFGHEQLATLQFFKTCYSDYDLEGNPDQILPFDELAEGVGIVRRQLNKYYANLACCIESAVAQKFPLPK